VLGPDESENREVAAVVPGAAAGKLVTGVVGVNVRGRLLAGSFLAWAADRWPARPSPGPPAAGRHDLPLDRRPLAGTN
jgi:hypothetical protein